MVDHAVLESVLKEGLDGDFGIQYLDATVLVSDLIENEPELFG
jgi:hypothetical protein